MNEENEKLNINNNVLMYKLGKRIKAAREGKDLTQFDLSGLVDLTVQSISQIEQGKNYPKMETFFKIAAALDTPPRNLVEGLGNSDCTSTLDEIIDLVAELPQKQQDLVLRLIMDVLDSLEEQE